MRTLSGIVALAVGAIFGTQVAAAEKIVRVWHTETEPQTIKAFNDIARRFEAKHPGVKIEAEGLAWGDLEGKIMASLAAGSPPELSHGQPITCTALQSKGLLLPLDDVVKSIGDANIWEQVRRVCNVGGKQYGLVHAAGTSLLIYRRDLAEKHGLKPPKTWADLVQAAKALTLDSNGDGRTDIYGISLPGDNLFINILLGELIKANGGQLFDNNNRPMLHRQEDDRNARVLARACPLRAARLGRARLSPDLPEPLRPEGCDDAGGLWPRRRHDREIRAEGHGERQDLRRLGEAARPERVGARGAGG